MEIKTLDYETRLNLFLSEYVKVNAPSLLDQRGLLTEVGRKAIASYLLIEGVFDTPLDMKMAALTDYGLILPDDLFKFWYDLFKFQEET